MCRGGLSLSLPFDQPIRARGPKLILMPERAIEYECCPYTYRPPCSQILPDKGIKRESTSIMCEGEREELEAAAIRPFAATPLSSPYLVQGQGTSVPAT